MKYTVVFERTPNNYSAYIPDLPGRVAAADTREETEQLIKEAMELHLEGMAEDGDPIPEPASYAKDIDVELPTKLAKHAR